MISQGEVSAFSPWLAYVMQERAVTAKWLANRAGVDESVINDLAAGKIRPEEAVFSIGEALLTPPESPRARMERVLETLSAHNDLRRW